MKYDSQYWYVTGGKMVSAYSGPVKYPDNGRWYYVSKDKENFPYSGSVSYNGKTFTVWNSVKV